MNNLEIKELFYKNKNYSKIKELLKNSNDSWSFNILGKIALDEQNEKLALEYFEKANNIYACAYCKFLSGELEEAKILLLLIQDNSSARNWLLSIIGLLLNEFLIEPTYFEIRNYYEQDLEMLFKFKQKEFIEKIIKKNSFLENYNKEIYKYSARVLLNNNYLEQSKLLLKKSLDIFYNDPETHFLLGEINEKENNTYMAETHYKKAIEVAGEYEPAKQKINHLSNWLYNLYYRVK